MKNYLLKFNNFIIISFLMILMSCGGNIDHELLTQSNDTIHLNDIKKNTRKNDFIGDITHIIKDTMTYGKMDTVELVISYNMPIENLIKDVETFKDGNTITQKIKITNIMKAKLVDPTKNSFKIIPITDSVQFVEFIDSTYTKWQWMVIPLKGGHRDLVINVDMIINNNYKSLKIYGDTIYVDIKFTDKLRDWIELNWKYITYIIGLIGAIIAWIYKEKINIFKK